MKKIFALIVLVPHISVAFAEDEKEEKDVPEAKTFVTEHSARAGGKNIEYTAIVGPH